MGKFMFVLYTKKTRLASIFPVKYFTFIILCFEAKKPLCFLYKLLVFIFSRPLFREAFRHFLQCGRLVPILVVLQDTQTSLRRNT